MKIRLLFVGLFLLLASAPLFAQSSSGRHPWLEDDFIVSAGGYLPSKKFTVRVDGSVPGDELNFERGVDVTSDDTTASISARWAFGEKWSLAGQYWSTSDSGRATLTQDIEWGDDIFKSGTNVGAGVTVDVGRLFFGRKFSTGPSHEFGAGLGLHWLKIGAYVEGEVFVNDTSGGIRRDSVDANAPLPNIGAWYWYALSPRWLVSTRLDWFGATFGDYSGSLWNANAGINYQPWEHVGIGLSYQYFSVNLDVDKTDWRGNVELRYGGPFLSLNFNW